MQRNYQETCNINHIKSSLIGQHNQSHLQVCKAERHINPITYG
jgi:hypothetical protein